MNIDSNVVLTLASYFLIAFGLLVVGFTIIGGIAFSRTQKGAAKSFTLLVQRGDLIRILTVTLILLVATLLTLLGKIEGAAMVGILSGIAGYVLGSLDKGIKGTDANKENEEG
jgi:uncharacterized membrane protein YedE/YeeE